MLKQATGGKGNYSRQQVEMAMAYFPKKWKRNLLKTPVSQEWWDKFYSLKPKKKTKGNSYIFPTKEDGWAWKPQEQDIPTSRSVSGKVPSKPNKEKVYKNFYKSPEWRELRVKVLQRNGCSCMMCGRNPREHGVVVHVDHIKPRSKYPNLSLDINNLQVLCEDCNVGKSNKYNTDYRPWKSITVEERLDIQLLCTNTFRNLLG